ncbi:acetaldehyde dehydrogenase (acetylating) [Kibdelosporangium philippinense]|uniref:Acetaldehyde dehydrogenase n=1 Tax=Kibdelosporangium philippinense TaxID=211113 RepID=A0ABS8ZD47_9PSEU|nr:acetaldehyde dehydrogenase (acetylating) [Kibdelosporangium philippinense]MCE7004780.1 acetaldehyde dehydrogenase (acetylating) [Kibdelosporangium philippinense]
MTTAVTRAAIVGAGHIGIDLMLKLRRSKHIDLRYMVGVDAATDGLSRAQKLGVEASDGGVDWLLARDDVDLAFDASSAAAHPLNAPRYAEAGIRVIDLTPSAVGPLVCPAVNFEDYRNALNINMITPAGQATVPIVRAISSVVPVTYAEVIASVSSRAAATGNIGGLASRTAVALEQIGGAAEGRAILIPAQAEPPTIMRDTVFCRITSRPDRTAITESLHQMIAKVAEYMPGYTLKAEPQFVDDRVAVFLEIRGSGDYFPDWAGNLDIMTAAAARAGDLFARTLVAA